MNAPQVSVIMPAYNSEKYIDEALGSVLSQRNVSTEVFVIDDGSSDGTWDKVCTFGSDVIGLQQENQGAYVARNRAAAKATGEWLAFLDADDFWAQDKLEKQLSLSLEGVDLIYTDSLNLDESGRVANRLSDIMALPDGDVFEDLLMSNFIATSSVLIRRSKFLELGAFTTEIKGCADWDLWLRCAASGGLVRVHPEPLTTYRWHDAQMSKNVVARQQDRLYVVAHAIALARRLGRNVSTQLERRAFGKTWATAAWFAMPHERGRAIFWSIRAIIKQPFHAEYYKLLVKSILGRR